MSPLLIFGASTRAAAFSAIRAGLRPVCGDLYADADLRAFAEVISVPDYPLCLAEAPDATLAGCPWMYTGALENWPDEVEHMTAKHRLWGMTADTLRRCRDPLVSTALLEQRGFPALRVRSQNQPPALDGTWLRKPLRSSAGRAISIWHPASEPLEEPHYFQQFMAGTPIAAAFLATNSDVVLLGISQQLIGCEELHVPEFGYAGSIYPCPIWSESGGGEQGNGPSAVDQIGRLGTDLAVGFGLRGLFGIDLIYDGNVAWMTELNPRYTASMELIECGRQLSLIDLHRRVFEVPDERHFLTNEGRPLEFFAKVILYADRDACAPDLSALIPKRITLSDLTQWADIPISGTEIVRGQPVFTMMGRDSHPERLRQRLMREARELWQLFN